MEDAGTSGVSDDHRTSPSWRSYVGGIRSILDHPAAFGAFRYLLVGDQTPLRAQIRQRLGGRRRVLDVCCGTGGFARDIGGHYVGIDLNRRYVRAASRRHAGSSRTFVVMDGLNLAFPDGAFDASLCISALHHFSDAQSARLLDEMRRVTRGTILIGDVDAAARSWIQRALMAADRGAWMRTSDHLRGLVAASLDIADVLHYRLGVYEAVILECTSAS
jgi:SAM-dependent methyltransferase